jgi:hypothetical protein
MFTKRTMKGVRRKMYEIERPKTILRVNIPKRVKNALERREKKEKSDRDLFLVIKLTERGIRIRIIKNVEKVESFSIFVQLFHRFKNISILYFPYFI